MAGRGELRKPLNGKPFPTFPNSFLLTRSNPSPPKTILKIFKNKEGGVEGGAGVVWERVRQIKDWGKAETKAIWATKHAIPKQGDSLF